jgi:hypothetical protein
LIGGGGRGGGGDGELAEPVSETAVEWLWLQLRDRLLQLFVDGFTRRLFIEMLAFLTKPVDKYIFRY